jgi:shikimate kinase
VTVPRHVVITGLMGSGKTTLGRALAEELGRPFVDSDTTLQRVTGESAREIAAGDGLERLHALEAELLRDALAAEVPAVVAAAASTIEDADARAALATPDIAVIWLRGAAPTLARRATPGGHRPTEALATISAQAPRREPLYASVAAATIDVDDLAPREVLAAALHALRSWRPPA